MLFIFNWHRQYRIVTISLLLTLWSIAPTAFGQPTPPPSGTAFVTTVDFMAGSSSYSVIDLATMGTFLDIVPNGVNPDVVVRYDSDRNLLYAVNRFGGDSIQRIDPRLGYTTPAEAELSTGNSSNPQDIAILGLDKAYVSRLASPLLLIMNPDTMTETESIDLNSLMQPGDVDGSPEPFRMLVHGDFVYLILQHLNQFAPFTPGQVVVIDTTMDTVSTTITLASRNPFSDLQFTAALPRGPRILVSSVDSFNVIDGGGIEAIDPVTNTVDDGFILSETTAGGDITYFEVVSATKAYAIVIVNLPDGSATNELIEFNPSTGTITSPMPLLTTPAFITNFAISNAGHLYVGPNDTVSPMPGVRVFDTNLNVELTAMPLNMGALPPGWITMVEQRQVALTVHKSGTGTGEVTSTPPGIMCGAVCTSNFLASSSVVLIAVPDAGSTFAGWQGENCTGTTGDCVVVLSQEKAVTAIFNAAQ